MESFSNAPEQIKAVINKYGKRLKHVGISDDKDGSYYSKRDGIMMKSGISSNKYGFEFLHEYGHYMDDKMGGMHENVSDDALFQKAYEIEKEHLYDSLGTFFNDLNSTGKVVKSDYLSDILSALTENEWEVMSFYYEKTGRFFGHESEYWEEAEENGRAETFANLFAIYAENDKDVVTFVEKWFPDLSRQFKNIIEEMVL